MSKTLKALVLTLSVSLLLLVMAGGMVPASTADGAYRQMGVYSEVLSRIRSEYVEEPNFSLVTDGALHGLLESLDANSSYLNPQEYKLYKQRRQDAKGNIGATISKRFGYAAVIAVLPNGPAAKAGLEGGDIIEAIEGTSTREMSLAEVRSLLAGEVGSNITFSVVRARRAEPQKVTITRDVVTVAPATDKIFDSNIGYIKVDALTRGRAQEIAQKIQAVQKQGARKLILDLRNVAEGDISEGVAVANLFLERGTITYLQGQKHPRETFTADPQKAITKLPLVVLVNRGTAGAAEVVAASVLENARGDLVGDKTFGNGAVQKLIELPDGSALMLSVAKYYTPGGKAIQDNPITPNILVATAEEASVDDGDTPSPTVPTPSKPEEDEQLRRAVEVLKARPA